MSNKPYGRGERTRRGFSDDNYYPAPRSPYPSAAPRFPASSSAPMGGPTVTVDASVKWFNPTKGFGFVAAPDGGKDIFVHSNTLKRSQIATLEPEQAVRMTVVPTQKGREATSVEIV